jgi:hypothetical protein
MFKSVSSVEKRARQVLASYQDWIDGSAGTLLSGRKPIRVQELINVHASIEMYRNLAAELVSDPDFETLSADMQDDLQALAQECAAAAEEVADEISPDAAWSRANETDKARLAKRLPVDSAAVERVRARVKLERRGTPAEPRSKKK